MKVLLNKIKKTEAFDVFVTVFTILLVAIAMYPLIVMLSSSVSDPTQVASGKVVFLPKGFTLEGYKRVFQDSSILRGYANTLFYTVFGTLINMIVTVPAGYVLSKKGIPGGNVFMGFFLFTMYFSGGLIPTFLIVKSLGLYNTRWVLLTLGAFNAYNCIICRTFFAGLPKELEEAAYIDGASVLRTFISIVLPVSKALIGVMVLYFAVGHWNSYFNAMVYTYDEALQPLQLVLRKILILQTSSAQMMASSGADELAAEQQQIASLIQYAVIVVSSLPLLIIYPFLQKYFDKGVMLGSVKG
jgi:putative aldouronate transport system permease protein